MENVYAHHLVLTDLQILRILLFSSGALDSFTIFKRSKFGLSLFFERYSKLLSASLIVEVEGVARLTPAGRELIENNLPRMNSSKKQWREVPSRFIGAHLSGDGFYIPNRELLSKNIFPD